MNSAATLRRAECLWHRCVPRVLIFSICITPLLASAGCRTSPQCRRETALLRAEILDIEDKYAALQSRYEANTVRLSELTGQPIDETIYDHHSNYQDVVIGEEIIGETATVLGTYPNEIIVENGLITGPPIIVDESSLHPGTSSLPPASVPNTHGVPSIISPRLPATRGSSTRPTPSPTPIRQPAGQLPLPEGASRGAESNSDFDLNVPELDRFRQRLSATGAGARLNKSQATEVVINRSATRGQDVDGVFGDEGLDLMIQPKNVDGKVILQTGDLSVSVNDPKARQQIGFWRFLPEEVELFFVNDEIASEGILLHLPWDQVAPRRSRLVVNVEFVTADGRVLTTSSDVRIKPAAEDYSADDPLVQKWTQRDPRWGDLETPSADDDASEQGDAISRWQPSTDNRSQYLQFDPPSQPTSRSRAPKWRPVR